jgi:hypothetical protein
MRSAALATTLALALAALALSACGSSSPPTKPRHAVRIDVENFGKQVQVSVSRTVDAGVQEISFHNQATGGHSAQILKFDEPHAPAEVLRVANAWGQHGKPLPSWIRLAGGFGVTKSGETRNGAIRLLPGAYLVVDLEARGKPAYAPFNVTGKPDDTRLPAAQGTIKAAEYSFSASGLRSGNHRVLFDNTGKQPHMLVAAPLKKGKTLADVRRAIKSHQSGASPLDEKDGVDLAALDGHASQTVDIDLKPGRYALLCFVPDRKGGPPHVVKGMISPATVR